MQTNKDQKTWQPLQPGEKQYTEEEIASFLQEKENPIFSFLKSHILDILWPLALLAAGGFLALRWTGGLDIYLLTSKVENIGQQIQQNNAACISAVESNKKLQGEYENAIDNLGNILENRMKKTKKTITSSGSVVPASILSE